MPWHAEGLTKNLSHTEPATRPEAVSKEPFSRGIRGGRKGEGTPKGDFTTKAPRAPRETSPKSEVRSPKHDRKNHSHADSAEAWRTTRMVYGYGAASRHASVWSDSGAGRTRALKRTYEGIPVKSDSGIFCGIFPTTYSASLFGARHLTVFG